MPLSRDQAQQRADDIQAFRRELERLQQEQALSLTAPQHRQLDAHHARLLDDYRHVFDIDPNQHARQLSLGMRIASLLGALALVASVLFLFHQFWGYFDTALQVALLVGASVASLLLTFAVRQRDASGYFSKMIALLALACLVLNTVMLGQIFNLTPSDNVLLAWAAYALLLAYACEARLLLAAGLICLLGFIAAKINAWSGFYWLNLEFPEHFFLAGLLCFLAPHWLPKGRFDSFASTYRLFGLLALLGPVLVLAHWGAGSHLPWSIELIEGGYQVLGFAGSALAIWLGARRDWPEVVNTGLCFFIIFLFSKLFDWWWEVMPKYLFFLMLSLVAVLILLILRRLRASQVKAEGMPNDA
ncbi:DUF2157 domain-containing protein [Pseudomonas sp. B392_1p]|jgi:uncharacterized membrane protein|uniref:DUF2157 domain-containing protein n=1 Tax=Pseudomonas sp. B392_1p TaxID=3457507 RepID=UPI003FD41BD0